jgi:cell fate regulator YaaT (PSP1 superfamily)
MGQVYLIRHGLMRRVSRFLSESDGLARGQAVVVRSWRGTELGEVLAADHAAQPKAPAAQVLRIARDDDFERARAAEYDRPRRLAACERILGDGVWPLELIDVEPMLDDRRTVLHYLGPHQLDTLGLLQALRDATDLDVIFEPAGVDQPEEKPESSGCGDCGSGGGCGTGGGCGAGSGSEDSHGGCSGCAVKSLVSARRVLAN